MQDMFNIQESQFALLLMLILGLTINWELCTLLYLIKITQLFTYNLIKTTDNCIDEFIYSSFLQVLFISCETKVNMAFHKQKLIFECLSNIVWQKPPKPYFLLIFHLHIDSKVPY